MVVQITPDIRLLASLLGQMRSLLARQCGIHDKKVGTHEGTQADVDGVLAELAFCKAFNVFPDFSLSPRSGSCDAIVKNKRIDIKSTRRTNGRLLATIKKNPDVDIYVLAILNDEHVTFPGFAYASELIDDKNIIDLGHGHSYGLEQCKLRQFKTNT